MESTRQAAKDCDPPAIAIRALNEQDLDRADRVLRLAFGTFLGLPDPLAWHGDADLVRTRWRARHTVAFTAMIDDELIGTNFVTRWGSVGFFGPLSVRPDFWDTGVAQHLLVPTMALFDSWNVSLAGLFTFAQSPKHLYLYQKYGFWPDHLTGIMAKKVERNVDAGHVLLLSTLRSEERKALINSCRELTDAMYPRLDLTDEIDAVIEQRLGDVLLILSSGRVNGMGICHTGAQTEAGSGVAYIKFGGVRPGENADERFADLLNACENYAGLQGLTTLSAGVSFRQERACRIMQAHGFRASFQGVAMYRGNIAAYNHPHSYIISDWR